MAPIPANKLPESPTALTPTTAAAARKSVTPQSVLASPDLTKPITTMDMNSTINPAGFIGLSSPTTGATAPALAPESVEAQKAQVLDELKLTVKDLAKGLRGVLGSQPAAEDFLATVLPPVMADPTQTDTVIAANLPQQATTAQKAQAKTVVEQAVAATKAAQAKTGAGNTATAPGGGGSLVDLAAKVKAQAAQDDPEKNGLLTMKQLEAAADKLAASDPSLKAQVTELKAKMQSTTADGKKIWQQDGDNGSLSNKEWEAFTKVLDAKTPAATPAVPPTTTPANTVASNTVTTPVTGGTTLPAITNQATATAQPVTTMEGTKPTTTPAPGKIDPNKQEITINGQSFTVADLLNKMSVTGSVTLDNGQVISASQINDAIRAKRGLPA
jgi:hypothetical protein